MGEGHFAARGRKDSKGWKWGLISLIPGKREVFHTIMPFTYSDIQATRSDIPNSPLLIRQKVEPGSDGNKYGLAGRDGTILRPPKYYNAFYFNDAGLAVVYEFGSGNGLLNMKGEEVLPTTYGTIFDEMRVNGMKEPVFILKDKDGKWGIVNGKGEILLPFQYGYISYARNTAKFGQWFHVEDLKSRRKLGAYNCTTRVLISPQYKSLGFGAESLVASTTISGKDQFEFLDLKGEKIAGLPNYNHVAASRYSPLVYKVEKNGLIGLVDAGGKVIFPCKFVHFYEAGPVYFRAKDKDEMIYYVDRSGKEYRPKETFADQSLR